MIDRAAFGRTGHQSSRVIFGAAALGAMVQEKADQLLDVLHEFGVNHLDTAAAYGDSELRLAPWLATRRDELFLATKTGRRRGDQARAQLERSLERLGVDQVDLIQLHNLVEDDEWAVAHGPGGAVEADPQLFLNSSSDARLLRPILEAASAGGPRPSREEMEADVAAQGIRPIFDGAALERI